MKNTQRQPSELLQEFLNYIDQVKSEYEMAHEAVGKEDKRLQDFLHELEFAKDRSERNKVSTKFQKSRRERRRQKDEVQRLELLVEFFNSQNHKNTFNKDQRKIPEYIQRSILQALHSRPVGDGRRCYL